jgi:hypothetical protein|tara:strand:+ start:487 stop:657 length:171 start_codon:yes stop_codon:yes gene_type:complete
MEKYIKVKIKSLSDDLKVGDFLEYKGVVYKFLGYEYGTYPIGENMETGETVTFPHY